jgi:acyl-CoA synthetase (AMP-forming)/AMP-acid ligase II
VIGALQNWLDQRADDRATHPAIVCEGVALTYADLATRATAAAERLADAGVRPGDRVAVLLDNGMAFAVALHAVMRAGAILVPLDRRLHASELQARLGAIEASHLLVQRATRDFGHCAFTGPELVQTFVDLVTWVEAGIKPAGDNVLDPAAVADPNFGCTFTDEVSPRIWDQPGLGFLKPPACPAP